MCFSCKVQFKMFVQKHQVLLLCLFFNVLNYCKCEKEDNACADRFFRVHQIGPWKKSMTNITQESVTNICEKSTCITKCCLSHQVIRNKANNYKCDQFEDLKKITNRTFDFSDIEIYKINEQNDLVKSNMHVDFNVVTFLFNIKFFKNMEKCTTGIPPPVRDTKKHYILEDGSMVTHEINRYVKYPKWAQGNFCVDYIVRETVNDYNITEMTIDFVFLMDRIPSSDIKPYRYFRIVACITSSIFLLLVVVVYASLPELRRIGGLVQMAYCSTLVFVFINNAVEYISYDYHNLTMQTRGRLAAVKYYFFFSSFLWMNIMSFDIWWTFRGSYKQRSIHRRGELVKFGWYALYAWGIPVLITTAVVIIENADLSAHPEIMKSFINYGFNSVEMMFYYNVPVGILLAVNCFFFLHTAYTYLRIKKDLDKFNKDSPISSKKTRFVMCLKLAVTMGVSWTLEVMNLPEWLTYIADTYYESIGVVIFIIFVCKRKILFKFCQRYGLQNRFEFVKKLDRKSSTSTTRTSKKRNTVDSEVSTTPTETQTETQT